MGSWPQSEFVTPTFIVAAGKNDGVAAPLIGSPAHNPVVVRVFLRSVDFHGVMLQKYTTNGNPKRVAPIRAHSRVFMVDAPKNRTVVPLCF